MSNISDNELLTKITEKNEYWERRNYVERIKLESKREGYLEALSDCKGIIITAELEKQKHEKDVEELYKAYEKEMKENEKYIEVINKMAKEILRLDTAYSKHEYDHAKMWGTEEGIINYFYGKVEKNEQIKRETNNTNIK